jgi:hypothetical protein
MLTEIDPQASDLRDRQAQIFRLGCPLVTLGAAPSKIRSNLPDTRCAQASCPAPQPGVHRSSRWPISRATKAGTRCRGTFVTRRFSRIMRAKGCCSVTARHPQNQRENHQ